MKQILVLFGGCSPEYSVSLASAYGVLTHMDRSLYQPIPVGITREGAWRWYGGALEAIPEDRWQQEPACLPCTLRLDRGGAALLLLDGSGRTEVLENLFGAMTKESGTIRLHGKEIKNKTPREAIKNGFALLTEERRATGIFGIRDIKENTVISNLKSYLAGGFCLSEKKMKEDADWAIQAMHIKTPSQSTQIRSLSGGNQQKVIIARELESGPSVLVMAHPTRGLDIGATSFVHDQMIAARARGVGILLISADFDEILEMSDRIVVCFEGRIMGEFSGSKPPINEISLAMTGK